MEKILIEAYELCKQYGDKTILKDVNLKVEKGSSIALIGHNGTGKSTLLKMLSGLTPVTSGKILRVPNLKFAYIPEYFPKLDLTVDEYMEHMGRIQNIDKKELIKRSEELYSLFYIQDMVDKPIKHLSKGTIQKVAVIQALLNKPDVMLLDEPLAGQDIKSQKNFIKIAQEYNESGVTFIMSCHEIFLVNQLAKSAYEIKDKTLVPIPVKRTKQSFDNNLDVMLFDKGSGLSNVKPEVLQWVQHSSENDDVIQLIVNKDKSNEILKDMLKEGFELRGMRGV